MFNYENPVWQFMSKIADLIILNTLVIVFSLPVFTIGAAWTALYYTLLKIVRKEETYIWREFWSSFKSNLKQATAIWVICFVFLAILSLDVYMWFMDPTLLPKALKITTIIVLFIVLSVTVYVFPILSHFENTVKKTMVNAFIVSFINIPYTILFIFLLVLPIGIILFEPRLLLLWAFCGISGPALLATYAWNRIFKKLEPQKEEEGQDNEDDEERIFSDELRENPEQEIAVKEAAKDTSEKTAEEAAEDTSEKTAEETAEDMSEKVTEETAEDTVKEK